MAKKKLVLRLDQTELDQIAKEEARIKKLEAQRVKLLTQKTELEKIFLEAKAAYDKASQPFWDKEREINDTAGRINVARAQISGIKDDAKRRLTPWFKWIRADGTPPIARTKFRYDMPKNGKPGKWHQCKFVSTCYRGFHACKANNIDEWKRLYCNLYLVEVGGKSEHDYNKSAFTKMRVIKKVTPAQVKKMAERFRLLEVK